MAWEHKADFNAAPVTKWRASQGGAPAGEKRSALTLTLILTLTLTLIPPLPLT